MSEWSAREERRWRPDRRCLAYTPTQRPPSHAASPSDHGSCNNNNNNNLVHGSCNNNNNNNLVHGSCNNNNNNNLVHGSCNNNNLVHGSCKCTSYTAVQSDVNTCTTREKEANMSNYGSSRRSHISTTTCFNIFQYYAKRLPRTNIFEMTHFVSSRM